MPPVKGSTRSYRASPLRERQAAETRHAILRAGRDLFLDQGYGATTLDQIAAKAGVSKPTVFTAVGNKQAVLAAVRDVALAGDDLPVPVAEREAFQAVVAEPDSFRALALMVEHLAELWRRYGPIREVMRGAASNGEPALRHLWDRSEQQRHHGARAFIDTLTTKSPLRDGLDPDTATDIMWMHMNPDVYMGLVGRRGWSEAAYCQWLVDTLATALLPPRRRSRQGRRMSTGAPSRSRR